MNEFEAVQNQIRDLEGIPVIDRRPDQNNLLAALYAKEARISGNNCVVFIMWLLSGDFISSSV